MNPKYDPGAKQMGITSNGVKEKFDECPSDLSRVSGYILELQARLEVYTKKSILSSAWTADGCCDVTRGLEKASG